MIPGSTLTKYHPKRMELGPSYAQITKTAIVLAVLSDIFFLDLDSVWAQSRHPEGLQRWHFFCKNPLAEAQLSRPSKRSNSMILGDFCQMFQKHDFFNETFEF